MDKEKYETYRNSRFYEYMESLVLVKEQLERSGVILIFVQTPAVEYINDFSDFEKERLGNWVFDFTNISAEDLEKMRAVYGEGVSVEYLGQIYDGVKVYERNGIKYLADFRSPLVNIVNGKRVTFHQPQNYHNTIYVFGQCTARGTGVEDKETIPSFLQENINEEFQNCYKVENCAVGCGSDLHDDIAHIKERNYKSGDIVLICSNLQIVPEEIFSEKKVPYFNTSKRFDRPHSFGEWFTDTTFHTNGIGNKVIADYIYGILKKNYLRRDITDQQTYLSLLEEMIEEDDEETILGVKSYISEIRNKYYKESSYNGAIVMNCNPFTQGHQYLIEYASKLVDYLYIFLLEEDKSFFSFKDRFELVKRGTEKFENVIVIPSGKYIVSAATFPGYFYRENDNTIRVDTGMDLRIFGKYIAPQLNIKIRFAGSEPIDYVTGQYVAEMANTLPQYGIEFIEVPRKENGDKVVSASYVRKWMKEQKWEEIEKIVPQTTYQYLIEKYKDGV